MKFSIKNLPTNLTKEISNEIALQLLKYSAREEDKLIEDIAEAGAQRIQQFLLKLLSDSPRLCASCYTVIRRAWGGDRHPLGFDETALLVSELVYARSKLSSLDYQEHFNNAIIDLIGGLENPMRKNLLIESGLHYRSYNHHLNFDSLDIAMAKHLTTIDLTSNKADLASMVDLFRELRLPICVTELFKQISNDFDSCVSVYKMMLDYSAYDDDYLDAIFCGLGKESFSRMHSVFLDDREYINVTRKLIRKYGSPTILSSEVVDELATALHYGTPVIMSELLRCYHEVDLHDDIKDLYFSNLASIIRDNRGLIPTKLAEDAVIRGEGTQFMNILITDYAERRILRCESMEEKAAALDSLMLENDTVSDQIYTIQSLVLKAVTAGGFDILPDYIGLSKAQTIRNLLGALDQDSLDLSDLAKKHPTARSAIISEGLSL